MKGLTKYLFRRAIGKRLEVVAKSQKVTGLKKLMQVYLVWISLFSAQ